MFRILGHFGTKIYASILDLVQTSLSILSIFLVWLLSQEFTSIGNIQMFLTRKSPHTSGPKFLDSLAQYTLLYFLI